MKYKIDGVQNIENMQIINRLCNIVNTENYYESGYKIASFILQNIYNLENITIYDIAEKTYVSRATVRRFCIDLGYENFYEFKCMMTEDFKKNYSKIFNRDSNSDLLNEYSKRIKDLNLIYDSLITKEFMYVIEEIVEIISKSNKIAILSSGMQLGNLKGAQIDMTMIGKVIHLIDYNKNDDDYLRGMSSDDTIFIISWTGKYLNLVEDKLCNYSPKKYLITCNDDLISDEFNKIYYLNMPEELKGDNIYYVGVDYDTYLVTKYIAPMICSLIVDTYVVKYGRNKNE